MFETFLLMCAAGAFLWVWGSLSLAKGKALKARRDWLAAEVSAGRLSIDVLLAFEQRNPQTRPQR